jgi:hypothetical protein
MATIVCVVGDKGGTGKSTWARALADLYRLNGLRVALFDGDWLARSLFKVFRAADAQGKALPLEKQDPRRSCMPYDARDRRLGRDLLLNSMALPGSDVMLHDLPAGFRSDIAVLMGAANPQEAVREFAASAAMLGHRIVFVNVFTPSPSDFHTAPWLAETLATRTDNAHVIAVRNGLFDPEAFALWRGEPSRTFAAAGGVEIDMPRLDSVTAVLCDQRQIRFSKATEDERMTLAERMRVASWFRRFAESVLPVAELLCLPPDIAARTAAALKFQPLDSDAAAASVNASPPEAPETPEAPAPEAKAPEAKPPEVKPPPPEAPPPAPPAPVAIQAEAPPPAEKSAAEARPSRKPGRGAAKADAPPAEERKEPGPPADAATERGDERFLLPADLPVI